LLFFINDLDYYAILTGIVSNKYVCAELRKDWVMVSDEGTSPRISPFDAIRKITEEGNEYWSARDLAKLLGYTQYNKFLPVIKKAEEACRNSDQRVEDHFTHTGEMVSIGSGARRKFNTVFLSRYACYLIVQNADPEKPIVSLGQTYFAVQTRRQELADELAALPEDQKRLILRSEMAIFNQQLAEAAHNAGVLRPEDFAVFTDHGYMGLYGGMRENDIHVRKNLKPHEKILDYIGSEELGANIFRATQTDAKLRRESIRGKERANKTHYQVGQEVRQTIKRLGGTMPEDLPTPAKSIQQLQHEEQKKLEQGQQPSLFEAPLEE
jgi:DNA-damage-inducible protein D